jgi:hypothetical protein
MTSDIPRHIEFGGEITGSTEVNVVKYAAGQYMATNVTTLSEVNGSKIHLQVQVISNATDSTTHTYHMLTLTSHKPFHSIWGTCYEYNNNTLLRSFQGVINTDGKMYVNGEIISGYSYVFTFDYNY